jgi:hypothetical protein
MIKFRYGSPGPSRESIREFIRTQRIHPYSVIDIGASDDQWSTPNAILDIRKTYFSGESFVGNINDADGWTEVLSAASVMGKFDFSICSHTLEDIAYPALTLRMLPLISKAGYIAMPSHYRELSRGLEYDSQYRGYFHHRWIFVPDQGVLTAIPKISALEYLKIEGDMNDQKAELQIWWQDEIPFKVLNDDYLGPNQPYIIKMYEDFFRRINDAL